MGCRLRLMLFFTFFLEILEDYVFGFGDVT